MWDEDDHKMWKDKEMAAASCYQTSRQPCGGRGLLLSWSRTYIKNLVYKERLNQMEEITHQMFRSNLRMLLATVGRMSMCSALPDWHRPAGPTPT